MLFLADTGNYLASLFLAALAIFHSYVNLPEGTPSSLSKSEVYLAGWVFAPLQDEKDKEILGMLESTWCSPSDLWDLALP